MSENPMPECITKAQADAALRALGIEPKGTGIVTVEIGIWKVTVTRNVKRDGHIVPPAGVKIEIPIDRAAAREAVA